VPRRGSKAKVNIRNLTPYTNFLKSKTHNFLNSWHKKVVSYICRKAWWLRLKGTNLENIMAEFEKQCGVYTAFTKVTEKLIKELLKENNIRVHSVTSRVKDKDSLRKNIGKSEKQLAKLEEIPDISGLRIITYFADDVNVVAKMIEKEFDVNEQLSVNKIDLLDPDRFGYVSLHYVVKLSESRLKLTEYKRFIACQCEIQIRSILQHAWAEIEHDLGYKSKLAIPKEIRRRFSRLAGLLEIADAEFDQIRDSLLQYEKEVPDQIIAAPQRVLINKASLNSLISTSSIVKELDEKIAKATNSNISGHYHDIEDLLNRFQCIGLETIAQIDSKLRSESSAIVNFAKQWVNEYSFQRSGLGYFNSGISLFYLNLYLVGKTFPFEKVVDYLKTFRMLENRNREKGARNLIQYAQK
jgi:putative GTP pyrophosphokinase